MQPAGSRKDAILAEMARINGSSGFRGADRMRRFLEYLVMETIEGRGSQIKEYSVALQVFDKPSSFDPKADSTVRSEASKLRNKLRLYYETEGSEDPVVISIPKGGYIAEWNERDATGNRAAATLTCGCSLSPAENRCVLPTILPTISSQPSLPMAR
jgi:hypothetical protein